MPSNNTAKKMAALQVNLRKRLNEIRAEKERTEVVVSSKPNPLANAKNAKEKAMLNNPLCKAKNLKNTFTCSKIIERNAELKGLSKPRNQTQKRNNPNSTPNSTPKNNLLTRTSNMIKKEPITNTFVEGEGSNTLWAGKVKKTGTRKLVFPEGCSDNDAPGLIKRIFTNKGKEYTKWCTTRKA